MKGKRARRVTWRGWICRYGSGGTAMLDAAASDSKTPLVCSTRREAEKLGEGLGGTAVRVTIMVEP